MNSNGVGLYSDMAFEEAVSHRMHSGIFEILGYLSIIDKNNLSVEDQVYILRVEELCKTLIKDLHEIIDSNSVKKKH